MSAAMLPTRVVDEGAAVPPGDAAGERGPRTNLLLAGELILSGEAEPQPVRLRNLSVAGAGIEMADPPSVGTMLILRRADEETAAEVVWRSEDACGLRFTAPIDLLRWMGDRRRRRAAAAQPKPAGPSLVEDLALARQLLARLEDGLADYPLLLTVLAHEMQAIDLTMQLLRGVEGQAAGRSGESLASVRRAARELLAVRRRRPG